MNNKSYRIEEARNGKVMNHFAGRVCTTTSLAKAQDELLYLYNIVVNDVLAESLEEAASFDADKTTADVTFVNGEVMGFTYDGRSFDIVESHIFTVFYDDDVNQPAALVDFATQEEAEDFIWKQMRGVTRVDTEYPCADDVFSSASVARYVVFQDEHLHDEPQSPVYESEYFYTED